jgi:N-glycosylase/DNA lyase
MATAANEIGLGCVEGAVGVSQVRLVGAGGEPVDLWRTISSHGVADLPPNRIDEDARSVELTVATGRGAPRTVLVSPGRPGYARVEVLGRAAGAAQQKLLLATVKHVLRLDENLAPFYEVAKEDPELSWVTKGAGRMLRSPTVFEEVVKTICTTNTAWSATVRMVSALVEHLGRPAAGARPGPFGRAFPTPEAMAEAGESFYRDIARTGYRGQYLQSLAASVASGELDLEGFASATAEELPDDELAARLLALPGVGPYATAHVMMLLGRYSPLILDSWSRPKYLRISGAKRAKDSTIERRFRRYAPYAGLAFWLYLTRDWVEEP